MGDQAGALIGARRAAIGIGGDRHDHHAPIAHGLQLAAQKQGLGARFPGVGHDLRRRLVIAGQGVETDVDARREHKPVIGQRRPAGEAHEARIGVHAGGQFGRDDDPLARQGLVAELLGGEVPAAVDHQIAEGAGGIDGVGLDQRHRHAHAVQIARAGRPAKAAADDDGFRLDLTNGAGRREGEGEGEGGGASAKNAASAGMAHGVLLWLASHWAMACVSTSLKPLARRFMRVAGRAPDRNAPMASLI